MSSDELIVSGPSALSAESKRARAILMGGVVPPSDVRTHPGKGGKTFSYVSHIWAQRQMNAAMRHMWDWEVLDWQLMPDGSVAVRGKMSLNWILEDSSIYTRTITAIGSFEDSTGKMPDANKVGAAGSRALVKCMMRAFNIGSEFYETESTMTVNQAWGTLKAYGLRNDVTEEAIVDAFKKQGIDQDSLLDRYAEAYRVVATLAGKVPLQESMPEDLKSD